MTHYNDVIMGVIASQITSLTIVYSTVYSGADQRKHQSSAPLAFVRGIHRRSVNSPHKWPVTRKMFPFDDVIMNLTQIILGPEAYTTRLLTLVKHEQWLGLASTVVGSLLTVREFVFTTYNKPMYKYWLEMSWNREWGNSFAICGTALWPRD